MIQSKSIIHSVHDSNIERLIVLANRSESYQWTDMHKSARDSVTSCHASWICMIMYGNAGIVFLRPLVLRKWTDPKLRWHIKGLYTVKSFSSVQSQFICIFQYESRALCTCVWHRIGAVNWAKTAVRCLSFSNIWPSLPTTCRVREKVWPVTCRWVRQTAAAHSINCTRWTNIRLQVCWHLDSVKRHR